MMDKGFSDLIGVFVNIFGEEEHDGQPNIVRSYLYVTVLDISFMKGRKKSVLGLIA